MAAIELQAYCTICNGAQDARTYRPAPALFFEFWRLAVDVLIVLSVGIRRTQQFDQLRGTCSHCAMHACILDIDSE